ncbi:MAG: RecQ family ATP-dependent DNA helicase [Flavobacteriaceae bacterium]
MQIKPLDILKQYWDYHEFRPLQEDIINNVIAQKDTFVLLPTGGGKSICYQIPALCMDGVCLVISPLIALMKDQVHNLTQKGIKAIALDSSLSFHDLDRELNNCLYGAYKFMYLSPERLQSELVLERLKHININLIAVDEAHCISQWGNDFRPAYSNIQNVKQVLPNTPIIALTGSARPNVVTDIINKLQLNSPTVYKSSFKRSNLAYMVLNTNDKQGKLLQILKKNSQPSIVYVRNRKQTKQLADYLVELNITAVNYHGGLTTQEKETHFNLWLTNQAQVMVATNAFGMGIDKPNVKTVIHLSPTENLENYYQEAGRAGRNGEKAFAIALVNDSDIESAHKQLTLALPNVSELKFIYKKLCSYLGIAYQEGEHITYDFNIYEFCKRYNLNITKTINAITFLDRQTVLRFSKEFKNKTTLQFLVDNYTLIRYISSHKHHNTLLNFILRKYGGAFEQTITIDLNLIATQIKQPKAVIKEQLLTIEKNNIIKLQLFDSDINITLLEPREDDKTINRIAKHLTQQNDLKLEQLKAVVNYIQDDKQCKEQLLLNYFGEESKTPCKQCSYCIAKKISEKENSINLHQTILLNLKQQPLSSSELQQQLQCSTEELLNTLGVLIDETVITLLPNNKYQINND